VESLEKPVGGRVLQAMAQAYPDPVDSYLLSMVLGCEASSLHATTSRLVDEGLAESHPPADPGDTRGETLTITDKGMAIADGLAADAADATALLERLEAAALRQLLDQRIRASRLPAAQADELRGSLGQVSDSALMDAAKVWAHQAVSDWRALVTVMQASPAGVGG
jgi:DNA-binding MarR family transcriptional regulator